MFSSIGLFLSIEAKGIDVCEIELEIGFSISFCIFSVLFCEISTSYLFKLIVSFEIVSVFVLIFITSSLFLSSFVLVSTKEIWFLFGSVKITFLLVFSSFWLGFSWITSWDLVLFSFFEKMNLFDYVKNWNLCFLNEYLFFDDQTFY
ncbi:hypothetical protein DR092_02960 [Mycoplasma hyorhinis]|nr:hypothetical protein [Mesomycoplasma hyorhinis]MXR09676.1 hypothetical protein [Mesomycoplasma hyorhinis]